MSWTTGDIIKATITWRDSRFQGVFRNIVHFRGHEGSLLNSQAPLIIDYIAATWLDRMRDQLATATYLSHVRIQNLGSDEAPDEEKTYDNNDYTGVLDGDVSDEPQKAACLTRRTFTKGRKGIGHYYHGPLPTRFHFRGELVIDPVGQGDLNDVADALGDPLLVATSIWRPIVCAADDKAGKPAMDCRTHTFGRLVVDMKSRRPLIGE